MIHVYVHLLALHIIEIYFYALALIEQGHNYSFSPVYLSEINFNIDHVFPGFLKPVLTQLSFQSHRLLFSHASAEVRGENTP